MRLRLLADDLTGALDTAARFTGRTGPMPVLWEGLALPADGPAAIDAGTRDLPEAAAVAAMHRLAPLLDGAEIAFKKIDSLLRGHVAAELAALLPRFDACVLAPAFPAQGRITRGGRQWARDGAIWREIGTAGVPVPLSDAESDADLDGIVARGRALPGRVLWCGTAGLAGALAGAAVPPRPMLAAPVLALIGSDHPVSAAQVAAAPPTLRLLTVPEPLGCDRAAAAALIAGRFAAVLATGTRPATLFVTGGETLRGLCRVLGAQGLVVDGEFEAGVPTSRLVGGAWDGQRVVSKSGAFGDPGFLGRLAAAAA